MIMIDKKNRIAITECLVLSIQLHLQMALLGREVVRIGRLEIRDYVSTAIVITIF